MQHGVHAPARSPTERPLKILAAHSASLSYQQGLLQAQHRLVCKGFTHEPGNRAMLQAAWRSPRATTSTSLRFMSDGLLSAASLALLRSAVCLLSCMHRHSLHAPSGWNESGTFTRLCLVKHIVMKSTGLLNFSAYHGGATCSLLAGDGRSQGQMSVLQQSRIPESY